MLGLVEDAHWADPTTIELLDLLVGRAAGLPLLLVVTHRPEFRAPWPASAHVAELRLGRLGPRDSAALVARVGSPPARGRFRRRCSSEIVERTDGVPLFAEELTKTVLGAPAPARAGAACDGPSVPASLHGLAQARASDRSSPGAPRRWPRPAP